MRVLFLTKTHSPNGGVERWISDLVVGLQVRGYECRLGLARGLRFHCPESYIDVHADLAEMEWQPLEGTTGVSWGRRRSLENLIRRAKPDIVVPVLLHEALGAASARRSTGQKFKIVYPVHESEVWAYEAVVEYSDCIDTVVSVNQLMWDAFSVLAEWPVERNFHVRCGVEPSIHSRRELLSSEVLELGYCGKLTEGQKRVSDLVGFCRTLDDLQQPYRLSVAGEGPAEATLREALGDHIKSDRLRLMGQLSKDQLYREFYPQLDALVITSEWETGPLVAWEAMMHGTLVVTSEYRGLRREGVLRDNENALVFPIGRPDDGARALERMAGDRTRFKQLAQKGQEFARDNLRVDQMNDEWASVLNAAKALPEKPSRTRSHYDQVGSPSGWVEYCARRILNRPVRHGDPHAEWPRYKPGRVSAQKRMAFVDRLDTLEDAMTGREPSGRGNGHPDENAVTHHKTCQ